MRTYKILPTSGNKFIPACLGLTYHGEKEYSRDEKAVFGDYICEVVHRSSKAIHFRVVGYNSQN